MLFILVSAQPLWFYTAGRSNVVHDPPVTPLLEPLTWMRYNTPPTSEGIRPGDVPAYGVMGYFGMGMYLNYVARRPNVGTPLAQLPWHEEAIRETFRFEFAEDEQDAMDILERHRIRYVVTIPFYLFLKNGATILGLAPDRWLHDTRTYEEEKISSRFNFRAPYFDLVDSRLLLLDGSEHTIRGKPIPALGRFRLVHECPQALNRSNFGDWSFDLPGDLRYCKIYEVVRGARIAGHAMPLSHVRIALDVRTGGTRRFTWRSSVRADEAGRYVFTVPYSTDWSDGVHAEGPYRIDLGDGRRVDLRIPEAAVIEGRTVAAPAGALDTFPRRGQIVGGPKGAGLTREGNAKCRKPHLKSPSSCRVSTRRKRCRPASARRGPRWSALGSQERSSWPTTDPRTGASRSPSRSGPAWCTSRGGDTGRLTLEGSRRRAGVIS